MVPDDSYAALPAERTHGSPGPAEVTVVLTVLNGMPYLPETVASILSQTVENFFFLIVNNGSSDGTGAFLQTITDKRAQVIHLEQTRSRPAVLNYALSQVHTDFVAIIDADDLADPSRLEKQLFFLRNHPAVVLVGSAVRYIDAQGKIIGQDIFALSHPDICDRLPLCNQFAHAACMFRRTAVLSAGGYPGHLLYAQDLGLWLALIKQGGEVANLPGLLASIRLHPSQATRDPAQRTARNKDSLWLAAALLTLPGLSLFAMQAAYLRLALAQYALGRGRQALLSCLKAGKLSFWRLWINPLLWERLRMELNHRITR